MRGCLPGHYDRMPGRDPVLDLVDGCYRGNHLTVGSNPLASTMAFKREV